MQALNANHIPQVSPLLSVLQVAPSFFDAPGAQGSSNTALPPAPAPQISGDQLPNITFAFASQVGYKVSHACNMYVAPKSATQVCPGEWHCTGQMAFTDLSGQGLDEKAYAPAGGSTCTALPSREPRDALGMCKGCINNASEMH